jgi:hypothetical protein
MSITPNLYAKARSEILALFGWDGDSLSADQVLRIDCAVSLRLCLDHLQGCIIRGESIDVARMLTASEALARLLPPAVLSTPPAEEHGDPRQVMWQIYREMRERGQVPPEGWHQHRINGLEAEVATLRAQLVGAGLTPALPDVVDCQVDTSGNLKTVITPTEADITPPSELGECYRGMRPGADDPKPSVTIDGSRVECHRSGVANQASAAPPAAPAAKPAWENWVDAELAGAHYSDPWSNRNA